MAAHVGVSGFCRSVGASSEYDYKRRSVGTGRVMYHAHIGLSTWDATLCALEHVVGGLKAQGHVLDRFGLCLDRAMSLPEPRRDTIARETGPVLTTDEWRSVGEQSWAQPHLGDFMIGTAASRENCMHALRHGVTTVGNLGQFFTFDVPGGGDDAEVTAATVAALEQMAAARADGAVVHSYLDDGPAMQLTHYANYLGWAALETHVVERMLGARLAHCFGGLVPQPRARALIALALPHLHEPDAVGSMIYGNTVDYTKDLVRNESVLSTYLLVDIATQLHRPTGHAINPVPLTENMRIPDAADILQVHRIAREIEREARRSADLFAWERFEDEAHEGARYAQTWAGRALGVLEEDGVDTRRAYDVLLALRQLDIRKLETRIDLRPPQALGDLEPWKAETSRSMFAEIMSNRSVQLNGMRVVLASLDVHDLVRDLLIKVLTSLGADVVLLPNDSLPASVVAAAEAESADAVIVSTYNGAALRQARAIADAVLSREYDGHIFMGGVLNEETDGQVPVDVSDQIRALGIHTVDDVVGLPTLLRSASWPTN